MRKLLLIPIAALIFTAAAVAPAGAGKVPVPGVGIEDACACGGGWHYVDSCQPAPVIYPGMNPAMQWCWNPSNGWHYHLWF
jgi:hypothetical protein